MLNPREATARKRIINAISRIQVLNSVCGGEDPKIGGSC